MRKSSGTFPLYHVDAFADRVFSGNSAAVCLLPTWLPDAELHAIAQENNLPVTAYLVREDNKFSVRWMTPEYELELCGHGAIAAGYIIFNVLEPAWQKVELQTRVALLQITRNDEWITLNFPVKSIEKCRDVSIVEQGLGLRPKEVYQHNTERCFAVYETEEEIRQLKPDMSILKQLEHRGISVTAKGSDVDFVSRTFYPKKMMSEDPATGASHCLLVPYWAERLNKTELHAKQLSSRGGEMLCQYQDDRVLIGGKAVMYMQGVVYKTNFNPS